MTNEEPALAAYCCRPNVIFNQVVVDFKPPILKIAPQGVIFAEELQPKLLPKSTLGKAVNYFLHEYDALRGYLKDGRFEIDNNLIENDIRSTAVGLKRWLFIAHPDAGWRSAVIYSAQSSCRRRGRN